MQQLIILFTFWIVYFVLHSVLASTQCKAFMRRLLKLHYKYYRLCYSLFAFVSLMLILFYAFTIDSNELWKVLMPEKIIACIMIITGALLMVRLSKKVFFYLSGADVLKKEQQPRRLLQTHSYKYVRHPLYSATLIFICGIALWHPSAVTLISCISITLYTIAGSYFEEKKLIAEFGESYLLYKSKTPMLVPKILNISRTS